MPLFDLPLDVLRAYRPDRDEPADFDHFWNGTLREAAGLALDPVETLRYFGGVNFAARATVPALYSVAPADLVCPLSTVFAAYHHYAGPKEIRVWPYNGHEGGSGYRQAVQLARVRALPAG